MEQTAEENAVLAADWITYLEETVNLSWRTVKRYKDSIVGAATSRGFVPLLEFAGDRPVWQVTHRQAKTWVNLPKLNGEDPSPSSRSNKQTAMKMFFTWMRDRRRLEVDQDIIDYKPRFFQDTEVERMRVQPKPIPDALWREFWRSDTVVPDDRLWMGMCYFLSYRIGEVANMRPEDVDLERRRMTPIRKGRTRHLLKYGELIDNTWLPVLDRTRGPVEPWLDYFEEVVRQRQRDGDTFLWPGTVGEKFIDPDTGEVKLRARMADITWFNKHLRGVLRDAGQPRNSFTPHMLRHSCGTNLWRAGVSRARIMDIMNHGKFETTLGYAEMSEDWDRERAKNRKVQELTERDHDD